MSKEMGLHLSSLDYYHDQQKRLHSIKQLRQYVQGTSTEGGPNRLALRRLMQRNQQATHDIYKHKNAVQPRRSAASPSTAASGPSLGQPLRAKQRNHSLHGGGSTLQDPKSSKNARKSELLDLINRIQQNRSLDPHIANDSVMPVTDFKQALDAVGVALPPQVSCLQR